MSDELTPEEQIAKLQTELDQAQKTAAEAEKKAESRANWGKALQHVRDQYPEVFNYVQDKTFGREATPPKLGAQPEPTPEPTFDDPMEAKLHQIEQKFNTRLEEVESAYERKLANAEHRLNQMQSDATLRETEKLHPDYRDRAGELDALLERYPALGKDPKGMDIAMSYLKRDAMLEAAKTEAAEELARREQEARSQFAPEPTGFTETPADDDVWNEGDTVGSKIAELFPE